MKIKKYLLKNKAQLVVVQAPQLLSATTMALIKAGPRYDPLGKEGLSHFVEHMIARGSQKWPTSAALAAVLEERGASDYAFSYYETNRFWIKSSGDDVDLAIENLMDRLYHPLLREEDIEAEKGVVKEELRILWSNPESLIWEAWSQAIWAGSGLGRIYIGDENSIKSFSKADIEVFRKNYYLPARTVFTVSGNVDPQGVYYKFNEYLDEDKKQDRLRTNSFSNGPLLGKGRKIKILTNETEDIAVAVGFPTVSFRHEDKIPLDLISVILGGGMSSRLRQKVMTPGYTYSIESYTENLSDCGYLMIRFTTSRRHLNRVLRIILEEIRDLKQNKISPKELSLAKGYLVGLLKVSIETSFDWAKWFADQYLFNPRLVLTPEEKVNKINKIDQDVIKNISQKYFLPENIYLAVVGKVKEEDILGSL